jgi:hypothetical protein
MRADLRRELDWYRPAHGDAPGRGIGNLLCALGLLVYTEVLGRLQRWNLDRANFQSAHGTERPELNFYAAFDRFDGGEYGRWRKEWEASHFDTSIYEVLRSGMVHEYRPKTSSKIHLGHDQPRGVDYKEGRLAFYVIPYFRHFCEVADELREEVLALENPGLPEPHLRQGPNAIYTGRPVGVVSPTS